MRSASKSDAAIDIACRAPVAGRGDPHIFDQQPWRVPLAEHPGDASCLKTRSTSRARRLRLVKTGEGAARRLAQLDAMPGWLRRGRRLMNCKYFCWRHARQRNQDDGRRHRPPGWTINSPAQNERSFATNDTPVSAQARPADLHRQLCRTKEAPYHHRRIVQQYRKRRHDPITLPAGCFAAASMREAAARRCEPSAASRRSSIGRQHPRPSNQHCR